MSEFHDRSVSEFNDRSVSEFKFEAISAGDLPQLRRWLREPHVAQYWQETDDEVEFRKKFLIELKERGVDAFIVHYGDRPIGFIQTYEAAKVGGGGGLALSPAFSGSTNS